MDSTWRRIDPLATILQDMGTNFEDDFENVFDDDLLRNMGIDMNYSPDELGYDENEGAEW